MTLTDRTDDFDFVVEDSLDAGPTIKPVEDRLDFQMVDGNQNEDFQRTDTWFSNEAEIAYRQSDTDSEAQEKLRSVDEGEELPAESRTVSHYYVWDPDTDDDGLTDGQEARWMTQALRAEYRTGTVWEFSKDRDGETDPWDPDTDDDGYWDGWIGVYGVDYSENVILYEEHLHDGNGIESDEIVTEQTETHHLDPQTTHENVGVDIDDDNVREHSKVHIGELHWGTDPTDDLGTDGVPQTDLSMEVDFFHEADGDLKSDEWRERLERNYRLYSIGLDVRYDDRNVFRSDLGNTYCNIGYQPRCIYHTTPFGVDDIVFINSNLKNLGTDTYLFVGDRAADSFVSPVLRPEQTGVNSEVGLAGYNVVDMTMVFTDAHDDDRNDIPSRLGLDRDEEMQALTAKTTVHEIGHQINAGEHDDDGDEVYSGSNADPTLESVTNPRTGRDIDEWSVMSSGSDTEQYVEPTNDVYTAFSIEELITIELP